MRLQDYVVLSSENILKTYGLESPNHRPNSFAYRCAEGCKDFLRDSGFDGMRVAGEDGMFPYLSALANFAFYSGCLRKNVQITMGGKVLEEISAKILGRLGLEGEIKYSGRGKRKPTLVLKMNGSYVARTLETLGVPRGCGNKAKYPSLAIPVYRQDLFNQALSGSFDENDVMIVRKLEGDATATLFSARLHPSSKRSLWLHFFTRPTPKKAKEFARESIKLIDFVIPETNLTERDIKTYRNNHGGHYAAINFRDDRLSCILDGNRHLLKFSPELQQLYGFDLPFEPVLI